MSDTISANDIKYLPVELNGTIYDVPISSFFTKKTNDAISGKKINVSEKEKEKSKKIKNPDIVVKLPSQTHGSISSSPPPRLLSESPPPGLLSASSPPFQTKSLSASPPPPPYKFGCNLFYPNHFGIILPNSIPQPIPQPQIVLQPIPQPQIVLQPIPQPQIVLQPNNSINYETSHGLRLCKTHDDKWYYLYNNKWFYLTRDIGFIDKTDVRFTILRQPYGKYSYVNQI